MNPYPPAKWEWLCFIVPVRGCNLLISVDIAVIVHSADLADVVCRTASMMHRWASKA